MKNKTCQRRNRRIEDHYIREVRVNYHTTCTSPFNIKDVASVVTFVRSVLTDNSREHVVALYLDCSHHIASYAIISIGTANGAPLCPREVFQRAIIVGAIAIVMAHNHPSGSIATSEEDLKVTKRLIECGDLLHIPVLDHVIVTNYEHVSLRDTTHLQFGRR